VHFGRFCSILYKNKQYELTSKDKLGVYLSEKKQAAKIAACYQLNKSNPI